MEDEQDDVVKLIYIVKRLNTIDKAQAPLDYGFITEADALAFFNKAVGALKFAGSVGMCYNYPTPRKITGHRTAVILCKTEDDFYYKLLCPAERAVCPACDGDGTELRGSLKGMAFSSEEMNEDPEFRESYFRGDYDTHCSTCNGNKVVDEADIEKLPENLQADYWRNVEEDQRHEAEERQRIRNLERGIHS